MNLLLWHLLNGWVVDSVIEENEHHDFWVGLTVRRPEGKYLPMGPFKTGPLEIDWREAR